MARLALPFDPVRAGQTCVAAPLPAGDPAQVRALARRYACHAADLRRTRARLNGGQVAWSGAAAVSFTQRLQAELPQLGSAADRYDAYSSALTGYASSLDAAQPRLRLIRSRLLNDLPSTDLPVTVPATRGAEILHSAQQFQAAYNAWSDALDRCRATLTDAGQADRDPHGWARVAHVLTELAHAETPLVDILTHPSLQHLSAALGTLATDLTILGTGLLFICPPAAGACFTVANIATGAQLATDVERRRRGEHVTNAQLGIEAMAAIPIVGKALKETQVAKEVLEFTPGTKTVTRLVPSGGLNAHEGLEGGHTLAKHVGKSLSYIRKRQIAEGLPMVSSFLDQDTAETSIANLIDANETRIQKWLQGDRFQLPLTGRTESVVGFFITEANHEPQEGREVKVILYRTDLLPTGYRIHTAMVRP